MSNIILHGAHGEYIFDPEDLNSFIGEGGMGRVFLGKEKNTCRKVAIKVLFRELTNNQNNIERFKMESTVKIRHKNLVEMIDFIESEGKYHIVSEYLEGITLEQKIREQYRNNQVFTHDEAKKIILPVLDGLEELHKNNFVHRDIKPSNIMLLDNGEIKLFDYGVIKKTDNVLKQIKLTKDGSFVGSIQYASPEQIRNLDTENVNSSSDIYSLGITLYEILTGKVPFDGSSEFEIMDKHTKDTIPAHENLNKGYYNLICNATAKEQKHRYKSVAEFRDDLLKLSNENENVSLIRNAWWNSKRFKMWAAILSFCILTCIVVFGLYGLYNNWQYIANVTKAKNFYDVARYDSALVYYNSAIEYKKTDSIKHKVAMLKILIPAMQDFYDAKYKSAFDRFQQAAELGSGAAYYYMGELTYDGIGTIKDYKKGWEYTNKADVNGFKMACWRIGYAYEKGRGVERNQDKANQYYIGAIEAVKKMAENDDPEALCVLACMLLSGRGVVKNEKAAFENHKKAAELGYAFEMDNLASMYWYGIGVSKDINEAIKWYQMSADKGNPGAQYSLGRIYMYGENGVQQDKDKGLNLLLKAAEQNYPRALNLLAVLYTNETYVQKDEKKAFYYAQRTVEFDKDESAFMSNLAFLYRHGVGTERDYVKAKEYYIKAIEIDSTKTENYLSIANLYREGGYGLEKSEAEFINYCQRAMDAGDTEAKILLSNYYYDK